MASIALQPTGSSRRKLHSLKVDMTPMVDLGFLLITFFVFTATLLQPSVTKLVMPKAGLSTPVPQSKSLTILLDKNKAYVYEGRWEDALEQHKIVATDYNLLSGIGDRIRAKQKTLSDKNSLVVLIKPLPTAAYQNIVAALDEMKINSVGTYTIVDASTEEAVYVANK